MRLDDRIALLELRRERRAAVAPELRDEIGHALRARPEGVELGDWLRALLRRLDDGRANDADRNVLTSCSPATLRAVLSLWERI